MNFLRKSGLLFLLVMALSCNADRVSPSPSWESLLGDTQLPTEKTLAGQSQKLSPTKKPLTSQPQKKQGWYDWVKSYVAPKDIKGAESGSVVGGALGALVTASAAAKPMFLLIWHYPFFFMDQQSFQCHHLHCLITGKEDASI